MGKIATKEEKSCSHPHYLPRPHDHTASQAILNVFNPLIHAAQSTSWQ
jgi:hypothetical protein